MRIISIHVGLTYESINIKRVLLTVFIVLKCLMACVLDVHFQENPVVRFICARVGLAALAALTIMLMALMALPVAP